VRDLATSLEFYETLGFGEIGRVTIEDGSTLVMLNLADDGDVVTLELVYNPKAASIDVDTGFSHFGVQVDSLDALLSRLATHGIAF